MTAIAAFDIGDKIYVVSDTRCCFNYSWYNNNTNKMIVHKSATGKRIETYIFISGTALLYQAISTCLILPVDNCSNPFDYIVQSFVPALRKALKDYEVDEPNFLMLVIREGQMFIISENYVVFHVDKPSCNVGSGGDFVEGYILGRAKQWRGLWREAGEVSLDNFEAIVNEAYVEANARFTSVSSQYVITPINKDTPIVVDE